MRWLANVMAPGEEKQFLPPDDAAGNMMDTEALAATYSTVRLSGVYRNALGDHQVASDALINLAEWRRVSKEARGRWEEPDPTKRLAKELAERLGMKTIVPALSAIEKRLGQ